MVAAISFAARPALGDVHVVRELGTLLLSRVVIDDLRWRAHATAAIIAAFAHHNLPRAALDATLRDETGAVCPPALRPTLARLMEAELGRARPRVRVLELLVEAVTAASWRRAASAAVCAALRAGDRPAIDALPALVPEPALRGRVRRIAATGVDDRPGLGTCHANLTEPRAEEAFPSSLPLVIALADEIIASRDAARVADLERAIARLGRRRAHGGVHAARVLLHAGDARAAAIRIAAIHERGVRSVGGYVLVREALARGDLAAARGLSQTIAGALDRQRADLAIAWSRVREAPLRARYALARITHPALQLEAWCLQLAIVLALRPAGASATWPHDHVARAVGAPAWTGESSVEPGVRASGMLGLLLLGKALTGHAASRDLAAARLRPVVAEPAARRELVETMVELGLDPLEATVVLRAAAGRVGLAARVGEPLLAEWFSRRAAAASSGTVSLPPAFVGGLGGERPSSPLADRSTLVRALHDEARAYTAPRRRPLIEAARAVLREASSDPAWDPELVASRARTLALLGGTLARDALIAAVDRATRASVAIGAVETLAWIDREAAGHAAIRFVLREPEPAWHVLARAEAYGGLPRGFARRWCGLERILVRHHGEPATRTWLAELVRLEGVPRVELLAWMVNCTCASLRDAARSGEAGPCNHVGPDAVLRGPDAVLAIARGRCEALRRVWPVEAARRVAEDPVLFETMELLHGARAITRKRVWRVADWRGLLARAASDRTGVVDDATVARCARALHVDPRVLRAGDLVGLGAIRERSLAVAGQRLRVRLLGKRADLLAYLRFADVPIASCYRSDSWYYQTSQDDTIAVWKDPLAMCFRIERQDGRPFGFVFGSFAELAGGPLAVLLNGLYLARRQLEVRAAVLGAIEDMLCRPLGVRRIGIASQFAGQGPLPPEYVHEIVPGTRLRALRREGELVTRSWDDISYVVNVPTDLALYWRELR